jgi:hypothetical protein
VVQVGGEVGQRRQLAGRRPPDRRQLVQRATPVVLDVVGRPFEVSGQAASPLRADAPVSGHPRTLGVMCNEMQRRSLKLGTSPTPACDAAERRAPAPIVLFRKSAPKRFTIGDKNGKPANGNPE